MDDKRLLGEVPMYKKRPERRADQAVIGSAPGPSDERALGLGY
jgi:hypothetical protein